MTDEGYLQSKLRELKEETEKIEQQMKTYNRITEKIKETLEQHQELISKLDDVEKFKGQILSDIANMIEKQEKVMLQELSGEVGKRIRSALVDAFEDWSEQLFLLVKNIVGTVVEGSATCIAQEMAQIEWVTKILIKNGLVTQTDMDNLEKDIRTGTRQHEIIIQETIAGHLAKHGMKDEDMKKLIKDEKIAKKLKGMTK